MAPVKSLRIQSVYMPHHSGKVPLRCSYTQEIVVRDLISGSLHDRLLPDIRCLMAVTLNRTVSALPLIVNQRFGSFVIGKRGDT